MARKIYSDEEKARAIELSTTVGNAEASRRTGIKSGTIASWVNRAGLSNADPEGRAEFIKVAQETWLQRRATLANRMGEVTDAAVEDLAKRIKNRTLTGAELVRAIAVLTDRAQLLSGEATNRTELATPERTPETEAELAQVIELAERAAS